MLDSWREDGVWDDVCRRLGFRLVLDKMTKTKNPMAGKEFEATFNMRNVGFAAPMNKRDVELVFVSKDDPNKKFVYPQNVDPRFWMPEEDITFTLSCTLDASMVGEYNVYLNLPDPYASLHDNPDFSIRLANLNVWEEATGYNLLTTVTVK